MYSNWLNQQSSTAHRVDTACGFAFLVSLSALKSAQSTVVARQPRNRGGVVGSAAQTA